MWIMKPFDHRGTRTYKRNKPNVGLLRPHPSERLILLPSFHSQLGQKLARGWSYCPISWEPCLLSIYPPLQLYSPGVACSGCRGSSAKDSASGWFQLLNQFLPTQLLGFKLKSCSRMPLAPLHIPSESSHPGRLYGRRVSDAVFPPFI